MFSRRRWVLSAALLCASGVRAQVPSLPGTHPIFVLNSQDASISQIDPVSLKEVRRIPTGKEPHHLYLSPDEKSLIVANAAGNSLTFIDPRTGDVQRVIHGIVDPYHLRFSPDMRWFVTAANRLNHVDLYRWQPQIAAQLLAIDLATQTPRWKVKTGRLPADVFLTPDDRLLLVGLTGDHFVEVYDLSATPPRLVKRISTGEGAHAFRSMGDGRHVFVSNRVANTISQIDYQALAVVAELPGPGGPDCMELLAGGRTLLVSSRWARKLSIIDIATRRVVRQIDVGRSPHGVWTLDHAPR
jgi:YVTN family beta-propeller protein